MSEAIAKILLQCTGREGGGPQEGREGPQEGRGHNKYSVDPREGRGHRKEGAITSIQ